MKEQSRILNLRQDGNKGYIDIYGAIVPDFWKFGDEDADVSANSFKNQINKFVDVDEIIVNINSPGGSVFEGVAIYNILKNHKAHITVNIDGLAASIASVIAMAGDTVKMPKNALFMVHNAMGQTFGNHHEVRKFANDLEKINQSVVNSYLMKNESLDKSKIQALLDAESWLDSNDMTELGLIDEVEEEKELVACSDLEMLKEYSKTPAQVTNMVETPQNTQDNTDKRSYEALKHKYDELLAKTKNNTPKPIRYL